MVKVNVFPPTIGIKEEMMFESNGSLYKYKVIGGHSDCSSILHCETDGILITGDNLVANHAANSSCMLAGFNQAGVEILRKFEKMGVDTFVPGHGPVVNTDYVIRSREWFVSMFRALGDLKSEGATKEEAIKSSKLPEFFEGDTPRQWERILEFWFDRV